MISGNYNYICDGVNWVLNNFVGWLFDNGVVVCIYLFVVDNFVFVLIGDLIGINLLLVLLCLEYWILLGLGDRCLDVDVFWFNIVYVFVFEFLGYSVVCYVKVYDLLVFVLVYMWFEIYLCYYYFGFFVFVGIVF